MFENLSFKSHTISCVLVSAANNSDNLTYNFIKFKWVVLTGLAWE